MARKSSLYLVFIGSLLLLFMLGWSVATAQRDECRYFPESGHVVCNEFLTFYENVSGAEFYFGYPISRAFHDELTDTWVQYFQRARLELHPDEIPELRVQLTPLGGFLYLPGDGQILEVPANTAACRSFPETEQQVCFDFLTFFEANGGVSQFGFPLSGFEYVNDRIVQYFHRAIFSWHPEMPPGQKVQLREVGRIYFNVRGEDPRYLESSPCPDCTIESILGLKVRAFTAKAMTSDGEQQSIFVIVQDQNLQAVPQAKVELNIRMPDDTAQTLLMPPTDENGISEWTFDVDSESIGVVEISITAQHLHLEKNTRTSFRIWY